MNSPSNLLVFRPSLAALAAAGLCSGLMLSPWATAQEWRLQPELRLGYEFDDNARLRTEPAQVQEIDGFILEGSLGIGYNTQRSSLEFTPRLRSRKYDEIPDVDSDDQFYDLTYDYEGLKSEFSLISSFDMESVRTAERSDVDLDADDPDEIPTDETGLAFTNQQRDRFRIVPEWSYELTERTSLDARYMYMDVSYEDDVASSLTDYSDQRIEGAVSRKMTERTTGYIGVGARKYENDESGNDIDGIGAVVGIETELSQTTRLQAEIGYEDTEQNATGESDSNIVGNLNVVTQLETVTMLAQYLRNMAAGGSGKVTARDSINFNLRKMFTERVSGGIGLRAYKTDNVGEQPVPAEERDQFEIRANMAVALSRAFSLEADYRYIQLDRSDTEGTADSNSIILWLVYRPTEIVN